MDKVINVPVGKWMGIWGLFFIVCAGYMNWLCFSTITYETAYYFGVENEDMNIVTAATFPVTVIGNLVTIC